MALIANPQHPGESQELEAAQGAAGKLGFAVRYFPVKDEVPPRRTSPRCC